MITTLTLMEYYVNRKNTLRKKQTKVNFQNYQEGVDAAK